MLQQDDTITPHLEVYTTANMARHQKSPTQLVCTTTLNQAQAPPHTCHPHDTAAAMPEGHNMARRKCITAYKDVEDVKDG